MPNIPERQVTNPTDLQFVARDSGLVVPAGNRGDGNVVQNLVKTTVNPKFEVPQGRAAMLGGVVEPIPVAAAPAGRQAETQPAQPENPDIENLRQQIQDLVEQMQNRGDEIDQLRDQIQQLTDRLQDLTNNINQLTQQNAQIIQQNANMLQLLQQIVTNQGGNLAPPTTTPATTPPATPTTPAPAPPPAATPPATPTTPTTTPPATTTAATPPTTPAPGNVPGNNPNQQPTPQQLQENLNNAESELNEIREELVEVTIRRKARSGDGWLHRRREDRHHYEDLMEQYQEALDNYLHALGALRKAEYDRNHPTEMSHQEVARLLTREAFEERRRFINQEFELNNQYLDQLGWFGKSLRKWANLSTKKKVAIGLVVGGGVAVTSGLLGAGLFGLAAGSAAKFSLGLFNRRASMRNVSEHSRDRMLDMVRRDLRRMLGDQILRNDSIGDEQLLEAYRGGLVGHVENEFDGYVQFAQRRNRIGNAILLASGVAGGFGVAGEAGALAFNPNIMDIPGIPDINMPHVPGLSHIPGLHHPSTSGIGPEHTAGGPGFGVGGGSPNLLENFNMNTIYAHNTTEFVNNTFGPEGLLAHQGIHAQGLTPEKAQHLAEYLQNHHWRTIEGMQTGPGGLEQHVVDSASWQDGIHNPSHAVAWASKDELERAMQVAHDQFDINFTTGG